MAAKQSSGAARRRRRGLALAALGLFLGAALPLLLPAIPESSAGTAARLVASVPGLHEVEAEPLRLHARWGGPALSLEDGRIRTGLSLHAVLGAWGLIVGLLAGLLVLVPPLRVPLLAGGLLGALLGLALASSFRIDGGDWARAVQGSLLRGLEGLPGLAEAPAPPPSPSDPPAMAPATEAADAEPPTEPTEPTEPTRAAGASGTAPGAGEAEEEEALPAEPAGDEGAAPAVVRAQPEASSPTATETIGWRLASHRGTVATAATRPPWTGDQPPPRLTARGAAWFVLYGALALIAAAFLVDAAGCRRWRHRLPRAMVGAALLSWILLAFAPAQLVRGLERAGAALPFATLSLVEMAAADESPTAESSESGRASRALDLAGQRLLVFRPSGAASVRPALLGVLLLVVLALLSPVVLLDSGWGAVKAGRKRVRRWVAGRRERKRLSHLEKASPSEEEREERKRERMREDLEEWLGGEGEKPPEEDS